MDKFRGGTVRFNDHADCAVRANGELLISGCPIGETLQRVEKLMCRGGGQGRPVEITDIRAGRKRGTGNPLFDEYRPRPLR
jgi:hypothetical protein